jgi:hypothetical protein
MIAANAQVSILPAAKEASGRSNVFGINATGLEKAHGPFGGPQVTVRWVGATTLEISYDTAGAVTRSKAAHENFSVKYRTLGSVDE